MKFAIRDDDLNFFFNPEKLEKNYKDIWNTCPISMSVVPYIMGNWPKWVNIFENMGPGIITDELLDKIKLDNTVYPIGQNTTLVRFISDKIKEGKIYLTIHAIHHRNTDPETPQFSRNFGIGAEFYTSQNLTIPLKEAIKYLENTFGQPIEVFTPPQNLYNINGLRAIINNNLAICGDFPNYKRLDILKLLSFYDLLKYSLYKLLNRGKQYPFALCNGKLKIVGHHRLQPGTNIHELYKAFDETYRRNGVFILSTHSYGFDFKMKNDTLKMGEVLQEFISYVSSKEEIEFVNIQQIFK